MTIYLAIDTATDIGSVAVGNADSLMAEVLLGTRRHAAATTPAVSEALGLAGASLASVTGIIVADGPGSFTGLRIGFASVQGIVRSRDGLHVLTAPSLLGAARLAAGFAPGPIAAVYDALRGEVFAAIYEFADGSVRTLLAPTLTTPAALAACGVQPVLAVGDGAALHASAMQAWTGRAPVGPPAGGPRASGLLQLLNLHGGLAPVNDIAAWEPAYGRNAEAQVRWERTHGRPLPGSAGQPG